MNAATQDSPPAFVLRLSRSGGEVRVQSGQTILNALLKAGVDVPYACLEGFCGLCEIPVLDGQPDHQDTVLSRRERAANDRLMACCSRCLGDSLVVDL